MKKKKVKIAGKQVTLAYCYGTEIIFHDLTGKDINESFNQLSLPEKEEEKEDEKDRRKLLLNVIFAAAFAYSESIEKDCEISHKTLMFQANPSELSEAFKCVAELRNDWYRLPSDDKPEKEEKKEKNS